MVSTAGGKDPTDREESPLAWRASDLMLDPSARRVVVIGGPDTGKTTMLQTMLPVSLGTTAFVDLDPGQSHLGPPATLAWGYWREGYRSLDDVTPERIYFVGATSPLACPAAAVAGAAAIVSDALEHVDRVLVDTSGAVNGRFARQLKVQKIRQIRPDVVVGLERHDEVDHILSEIKQAGLARVVVAKTPAPVTSKSPKERAAYRRRRFASYFASSRVVQVPLLSVEIVRFGGREETPASLDDFVEGLLVGLVDRVGRHLAMGVIQRVDRQTGQAEVLAPLDPGARVGAIIPGRMRLTEKGREQPLRR